MRQLLVAGVVLVSVAFTAGAARADAIPPPAVLCPKGDRVVNDHGGGHCEPTKCPPDKVLTAGPKGYPVCLPPAPRDCPPGWGGVPGPHCSLRLCGPRFTPCEVGTTCRETPICTRDEQGYSENRVDAPMRSSLAGDRAVAPSREYVGACDATLACGVREVCRSVRVCLPAEKTSPAATPANALANRIWFTSEIPADEPVLTRSAVGASPGDAGTSAKDGGASPSATPTATPASVAPQTGRGRAGCDVAAPLGAASTYGGLLASAGLTLAVRARRRRRRAP